MSSRRGTPSPEVGAGEAAGAELGLHDGRYRPPAERLDPLEPRGIRRATTVGLLPADRVEDGPLDAHTEPGDPVPCGRDTRGDRRERDGRGRRHHGRDRVALERSDLGQRVRMLGEGGPAQTVEHEQHDGPSAGDGGGQPVARAASHQRRRHVGHVRAAVVGLDRLHGWRLRPATTRRAARRVAGRAAGPDARADAMG